MHLFIVRPELPEWWGMFFRNKQDKKYFDFNQKCIFSLKKFTYSLCLLYRICPFHYTIVNPSISVHCKNSWLFCVIQHRRRYCSVPLLLYNNLKKNTENVLGYFHCIPDLKVP